MMTVSEAAALLRTYDDVLLLTHVRPDGDTVGCAAALCGALRTLGKTAYLLPNPELTRSNAPYFLPYAAPEGFVPRHVVATDVATTDLLPENARQYVDRIDMAFDHHPSFTHFAKHNLVRPEAAACGEVIYDLILELCPLTAELALPLYVAVSTDTGCFVYSNTTPHTHEVARALMETGIDYKTVNKTFFRTKTRVRMQLEAAMLSACEFYDHDRVAILSVPMSMMERFHATESDAEELSSLGAMIEGVDCAITMRELRPDVWKMSVRTGPRVNATEVCQLLGGGGHAAAAGCTVSVPWKEAKRQILDAVARVTGVTI